MPRLEAQTLKRIREGIEAAALDLFIRQGYAATSTRDIAKAAGFTAGALYAHYPSKEALFAAVVRGYRDRFIADGPLRRALGETEFPYDLPRLAVAIRQMVRNHRAYWMLWYVDVLEFEGRHFRSTLAPRSVIREPALKKRLQALKASGKLRVDPDLAFVMVYMHLFNYFLVETLFGGNRHYGVPEERAVKAMSEVFLNGLLA
jgi:AcrR family transcriptional regulator